MLGLVEHALDRLHDALGATSGDRLLDPAGKRLRARRHIIGQVVEVGLAHRLAEGIVGRLEIGVDVVAHLLGFGVELLGELANAVGDRVREGAQ